MTCHNDYSSLLEYLYDLPEEQERLTFQQHLASCVNCPSLLKRAQRQRLLLSRAACLNYPKLRFTPELLGERRLSVPPAATSRRRLFVFATAACLLLAGGFVLWQGMLKQNDQVVQTPSTAATSEGKAVPDNKDVHIADGRGSTVAVASVRTMRPAAMPASAAPWAGHVEKIEALPGQAWLSVAKSSQDAVAKCAVGDRLTLSRVAMEPIAKVEVIVVEKRTELGQTWLLLSVPANTLGRLRLRDDVQLRPVAAK